MNNFENLDEMLSGITGGSSESSLFDSALVSSLADRPHCKLNCTYACKTDARGTTLGSVLGTLV